MRARHSSGPMPSRSVTPGRNPSMSPSASATSRSTASRPAAVFMSTATERRPRLRRSKRGSRFIPSPESAHPVHADDVPRPCPRASSRTSAPADPRELDDPEAFERSHPRPLLLLHPREARWYIKLQRADRPGRALVRGSRFRRERERAVPIHRWRGGPGGGAGRREASSEKVEFEVCRSDWPDPPTSARSIRRPVSPNRAGSRSRCRG